MTTVLIADQDPHIVTELRTELVACGYQVTTAADYAATLHAVVRIRPTVVLLELDLPGASDTAGIAALRAWTDAPIIVLSRRTDSDTTVRALDAGADYFLTTPFDTPELLARLRASLRRAAIPTNDPAMVISTDSFTVDIAERRVRRDGVEVHLTPTEWRVLEVLIRNQGHLITHQQLLTEIWGPHHPTDTLCLRVYLSQLRRKLEPQPAHPRHLITEPGAGYRFHTESTTLTPRPPLPA